MKKIYYLKTCSTCQRILKELHGYIDDFELINIKEIPLTEEDVSYIKSMTSTFESFFSRRSQSYKKMNLKEKNLTEQDFKSLILSDYTFLKRPVIIDGEKIFIGSDKKNILELTNHLKS